MVALSNALILPWHKVVDQMQGAHSRSCVLSFSPHTLILFCTQTDWSGRAMKHAAFVAALSKPYMDFATRPDIVVAPQANGKHGENTQNAAAFIFIHALFYF